MLTVADLLDLNDTIAADLFAGKTYPWEALEEIGDYIRRLGPTLSPEEFDHPAEDVWIAKDAKVFPNPPPPTSVAPASLTMRRRSAIAPSFGVGVAPS